MRPETNGTDGSAREGAAVDDLHERMAAELLADPQMEQLLAEALELAGGDPDAAATLVRLRLRLERPADAAARAAYRRTVAVVADDAAAADRRGHEDEDRAGGARG